MNVNKSAPSVGVYWNLVLVMDKGGNIPRLGNREYEREDGWSEVRNAGQICVGRCGLRPDNVGILAGFLERKISNFRNMMITGVRSLENRKCILISLKPKKSVIASLFSGFGDCFSATRVSDMLMPISVMLGANGSDIWNVKPNATEISFKDFSTSIRQIANGGKSRIRLKRPRVPLPVRFSNWFRKTFGPQKPRLQLSRPPEMDEKSYKYLDARRQRLSMERGAAPRRRSICVLRFGRRLSVCLGWPKKVVMLAGKVSDARAGFCIISRNEL